jgi:hypothetical protein
VKLNLTNQPMSTQLRFLCCLSLFVCAVSSAQDGPKTPEETFAERYGRRSPEQKAREARAPAQVPAVYRTVEGKVYDVSHNALWKHFAGECLAILSDGIILQEMKTNRVQKIARGSLNDAQSHGAYSGPATSYVASETREPSKRIFLRNYSSSLWPTTGKWIEGVAMQTGVFQHGNETLEQWDYGVDYTPQPRTLTPEEVAAAKTEADRKKAERDAAILKFELENSEKGSDLYQYRVGLRYLNGNGVPKDLAKARDYLSKAAAQGNKEAAAELAKLPVP